MFYFMHCSALNAHTIQVFLMAVNRILGHNSSKYSHNTLNDSFTTTTTKISSNSLKDYSVFLKKATFSCV
jgi:hypothetical protein